MNKINIGKLLNYGVCLIISLFLGAVSYLIATTFLGGRFLFNITGCFYGNFGYGGPDCNIALDDMFTKGGTILFSVPWFVLFLRIFKKNE